METGEASWKLREQLAAGRTVGEMNITIHKGKIVSTVQSSSTGGPAHSPPHTTNNTVPEDQTVRWLLVHQPQQHLCLGVSALTAMAFILR